MARSSPPIGVRGQSSLLLRQSLQPLSQSREKTTQFHKLAFIQAGPGGVKISIRQLFDGVTQRLPLPGDPVCPRHVCFFHPSSSEQFLDRFFVICGCVPSKSSLLDELGRGSHLAGCGSCWPSRSKRGPPPCAISLDASGTAVALCNERVSALLTVLRKLVEKAAYDSATTPGLLFYAGSRPKSGSTMGRMRISAMRE
jgi:hypothetical protein